MSKICSELISGEVVILGHEHQFPVPTADPASFMEAVTISTRPRRGRKKLFKLNVSSPLLDSPHSVSPFFSVDSYQEVIQFKPLKLNYFLFIVQHLSILS